jgi:hypothetical protein
MELEESQTKQKSSYYSSEPLSSYKKRLEDEHKRLVAAKEKKIQQYKEQLKDQKTGRAMSKRTFDHGLTQKVVRYLPIEIKEVGDGEEARTKKINKEELKLKVKNDKSEFELKEDSENEFRYEEDDDMK